MAGRTTARSRNLGATKRPSSPAPLKSIERRLSAPTAEAVADAPLVSPSDQAAAPAEKPANPQQPAAIENLRAAEFYLNRELTWHPTLEAGLAAAKAQGKPLLWIHALGDLTGDL